MDLHFSVIYLQCYTSYIQEAENRTSIHRKFYYA